jgi:predicted MPP superfamily phosphohydrolase
MSDPMADLDESANPPAPAARRKMSRRKFFAALGGAALAAGGVGGYAWRIEPHWIEVVSRDLPLKNLPAGLVGKTVVLVSDLHVGPAVDHDYLRDAMDRINGLKPDMVLVAGDLVSANREDFSLNIVSLLGRLNKPSLGIFAVPGNHDYGFGWLSPGLADKLTERLAGIGVRMLRNELVRIGGGSGGSLQLLGIDDLWANNGFTDESGAGQFFHPERPLAMLDQADPAIVLIHNPDAVDLPRWCEFRGWFLCGHTHGGQVCLPLIGPILLPVKNRRYAAGEVELGNGRRLYVTRGVGYLRRIRLLCRPEITLLRMVEAPSLKQTPTTGR